MATGTGLFTTIPGTSIMAANTDENGLFTLVKCATGDIPTGSGYAKGCILINTTTGSIYTNQGTSSAASFVVLT